MNMTLNPISGGKSAENPYSNFFKDANQRALHHVTAVFVSVDRSGRRLYLEALGVCGAIIASRLKDSCGLLFR